MYQNGTNRENQLRILNLLWNPQKLFAVVDLKKNLKFEVSKKVLVSFQYRPKKKVWSFLDEIKNKKTTTWFYWLGCIHNLYEDFFSKLHIMKTYLSIWLPIFFIQLKKSIFQNSINYSTLVDIYRGEPRRQGGCVQQRHKEKVGPSSVQNQ